MEDIAVINDLACFSIESGNYRAALDVLTCCLACVKQLKDYREPTCCAEQHKHDDDTEQPSIVDVDVDVNRTGTTENVATVLKKAKTKLLLSLTAAASLSSASTTSKRKSCHNQNHTSPTESRGTTVAQPRKRRRSEHETTESPEENNHDDRDNEDTAPAAAAVFLDDSNIYRGKNDPNKHHLGNPCSSNHNNHNNINDDNNSSTTTDTDSDCGSSSSSFVYRKPLRLTDSQWTRIRDYREFVPRAERSCCCPCCQLLFRSEQRRKIEREIELAISSNLIFNIALSHHLIAVASTSTSSSTATTSARRTTAATPYGGFDTSSDSEREPYDSESWDSDNDNYIDTDDEGSSANGYDDEDDCDEDDCDDDDDDDDDMECNSHVLRREQRLKGALRLYELGFWVHAKRIAIVESSSSSSSSFSPHLPTATGTTASVEQQQQQLFGRDLGASNNSTGSDPHERIHNKTKDTTDHHELHSATRYALALINNCAHIHEILGNSDRTSVYRNRLLSFLMLIIDSGESAREIVGDDLALDGYLKNALSSSGNTTTNGFRGEERVLAAAA